jgi:cytochrome c oxidase accessory protein FixG
MYLRHSQVMTRKTIPIIASTSPDDDGRLFLIESKNTIYVRAVTGWFATWRWALVWLTQAVFYGLPWLDWHGRQAVLFDLETQRFFLFGLVLYPQDLIYLAVLLMLAALLLFFVTAVVGRVWCGFACPQTVYTQIFLWVERQTEGNHHARKRLDAMTWGPEKLARKSAKQLLWLGISLWTGLTFVGYFTPIHTVAAALPLLGLGPWESFWIGFYGLATYVNAGYLREQLCKHACPYARFQGAMMDRDTLVIGYDTTRGETRGSRPRNADPKALGLGDCIDCTLCVQVCPTGIDIRNGLQSNCIGCAACIDVCDTVMAQMNYPLGLVRFSTQNGLDQGWDKSTLLKRVLRQRVLIYGALLLLATSAFVTSVSQRSPVRMDVVRDRGVIARVVNNGEVENIYRLHLMNASEANQRYQVSVRGTEGLALVAPLTVALGPVEAQTVPVAVRLDSAQAAVFSGQTLPFEFEVAQLTPRVGDLQARVREKTTFHVPR